MTRVRNDPARYVKRADVAKQATKVKRTPAKLTVAQGTQVVASLRQVSFEQRGYIPFGRIVSKS